MDLVRQYHAQLQAGVPDIETRALEFVKMWLTAHVLGTDREIGAYAAERPVGGESGLSPSSLLT